MSSVLIIVQSWGQQANESAWGVQWIADHAASQKTANKPVIIGKCTDIILLLDFLICDISRGIWCYGQPGTNLYWLVQRDHILRSDGRFDLAGWITTFDRTVTQRRLCCLPFEYRVHNTRVGCGCAQGPWMSLLSFSWISFCKISLPHKV